MIQSIPMPNDMREGLSSLISFLESDNAVEFDNILIELNKKYRDLNENFTVNGLSWLQQSAIINKPKMVELLLSKPGINVNYIAPMGLTALKLAFVHKHYSIAVDLLFRHDIKVNCPDNLGLTTLIVALDGINDSTEIQHESAIALVIAKGADPNVLSNNIINVNNIISHETALTIASHKNNERAIKILIKMKEINLNIKNSLGNTALIILSTKGYLNSAKILLEQSGVLEKHYVDIDAQDNFGMTALMFASSRGNQDMTSLLLANNANANIQGNILVEGKLVTGMTALMIASTMGNNEIVKLLVPFADINLENSDGRSALFLAIEKKKIDTVSLLLQSGAFLFSKDNLSAKQFADSRGESEISKMIITEFFNIILKFQNDHLGSFLTDKIDPIEVIQTSLIIDQADSLLSQNSEFNYQLNEQSEILLIKNYHENGAVDNWGILNPSNSIGINLIADFKHLYNNPNDRGKQTDFALDIIFLTDIIMKTSFSSFAVVGKLCGSITGIVYYQHYGQIINQVITPLVFFSMPYLPIPENAKATIKTFTAFATVASSGYNLYDAFSDELYDLYDQTLDLLGYNSSILDKSIFDHT